MLKRPSFAALGAIFVALICSIQAWAAPGDILESFSINNITGDGRTPTTPQGIAYHDGYLWVLDFGTDRIYRVYPEDVLDEDGVTVLFNAGDSDFNIPVTDTDNPPLNSDGNPIPTCGAIPAGQYCGGGGLTFAENFLWNSSPITDDIIKIDPVDGDNMESENALASLAFPAPTDMAHDGTNFWILDWQQNNITRVRPEDGAELGTIPGPSSLPSFASNPSVTNARPFGLAYDGQALWVADRQERTIYRVRTTDGAILAYFNSPGTSPHGLDWDGESLWHVDPSTGLIYRLDTGVIPFGLTGCIMKNGRGIDADVILHQTATPDQSSSTDVDGCFHFATFLSGVPMQVGLSEQGVDEKPVITLTGGNVTLIVGDTYAEPGYIATDTEDGDITSDVVAAPDVINTPAIIDTSVPGPVNGVRVEYDVVDSKGNRADTVYRTVYVLEVDVIPPVITLNGTSPMYVEQGTSYVEPGATALDARDGDITARIAITGSVNAAVAGTYTRTYNVSDTAGNAATTVTRTVIVRDTNAPTIVINGANPMTLEKGNTFTDPGVTATDNINGNITANVVATGTIPTNIVGSYLINYNVTDSAGNNAPTVTRRVNVVDTTPPVITRLGTASINHELNTPYTDPGATASDFLGDNLTSSIVVSGTVNTAVAGTYTLRYNVSDASGNAATEISRTVIVADTGAPSITLLGSSPLQHERGAAYTDPGATASDAIDGNLTASIVRTGTVNVNATGSNILTYNVSDSTGNAATPVTRTVNVSDTTPPSITLTGASTIQHPLGQAYTDAGATANDNIDGNISASIVTSGSVNSNVAGSYFITYNVNDASGNPAAPVTRLVQVADRTAPVISLVGANPLSHEMNTVFVDPGATASDNVDGNISANVSVSGTVNAGVLGTYTLRYRVTDAAGNQAAEVARTVNVVDTGSPSITLNGANPILHQLQTTFTDPGATAVDAVDGNLTSSIVATGSVNANTAGTYTLTYNVTDSQGNAAATVTRSVIVADRVPPVITLTGANPLNVAQGSTFTDPGATASDVISGNLTASIVRTGSINTAVAGTYTLTYNVSDAAGNAATPVVRTVNISDTTRPVITLVGANPLSHEVNTVFVDPGATASDNVDGNISSSVSVSGTVNAGIQGSYTLTYRVTDAAGNQALAVTRTVNVVDTGAPSITLNGANPLLHQLQTAYTDPGATAIDAVDGNLTSSIVAAGSVNANTAGTYTLTYNVTDSQGNAAATVTRSVIVADRVPPVITLTGANPLSAAQGSAFTDPGATATDAISGNLTASIVRTGSVNTAVAGSYTLTYNVSDAAGNAATPVVRTVNVSDITRPVITLLGSATVNHLGGTVYVDAGATASDNVDGNISNRIGVSGIVNANAPGTYTLTYNVSDVAGNAALPVTRTVIVTDPAGAPVITITGANPLNHNINTPYTDPGATAFDTVDGSLTSSIVTTGSVNPNVAGTYQINYNVRDSSNNAAIQQTRTVNVADFMSPVITRIGAATVNHQVGTTYSDPGATATDNVDGSLTSSIVVSGSVNSNVVDTYVISYNVTDAAGNAATQVSRTVIVGDSIPPVITLTGASTISLTMGSTFTDPGATATDNVDGNITSRIVVSGDAVNTNTVGTYTRHYDVTDNAGNAAPRATRFIVVRDGTPPVITLLGSNPTNHELGQPYTDAGATANDNVDGDLTSSIAVTGTVNTGVTGSYNLTYNVADSSSNNAATVTRVVNVRDLTRPVITLNGSASIDHRLGVAYTDAGATATDNIDGTITARITITGSVNINAAGTYTLRFNVSDLAGNTAVEVVRTVRVIDPTTETIQAETATQVGTFTAGDDINDTGSGHVDIVNTNAGDYLQFSPTLFNLGYNLTIRYASESDSSSLEVILNGATIGNIALPATGSNTTYQNSADFSILPIAGSNDLRLRLNVDASNKHLDRITLTPQ